MGDGVERNANENSSNNNKEVVVMDTPERTKSNQIATSIGKFEESPVFNFLNSLSPIKPVKSIHITQTINPLSFASLPSIFNSPHVLRESRFLRRHQLADPSKPEFSSVVGSQVDTNNISTDATDKLDERPKNLIPRESEYACNSALVPFVEGGASQRSSYESEMNMEGVSQIDENKEATSCDWESLIADASDLLIFESPNGPDSSYKKSIEPGNGFCMRMEYEMQNRHSLCAVASAEQVVDGTEPEHLSTQPGEGSEVIKNDDIIAGPSVNFPGEKTDYEHLSGFHRGIRRRCLVFDMTGARRMCLDESSGPDSLSDGIASSDGHQTGPTKTGTDPSHHALPGIGLHLNALATTPNDYKIVNHESSASGRLLIAPCPSVNFHSPSTGQELLNNTLPYGSSEREINSVENVDQPVDDACVANEEINHSPKKKRRREAGEAEACKRCNCKKSKCLKLYCECFAAGVYCVEPCACIDCFNKPIHEDTVLATRKQIESRNPLAFAPKVIRGSDSLSETGDDSSKTPASARHKRGCNCKKSGCLKKYCECYQGGVGCSINCRCEGCKNAFGRKDGSGVIGTEAEMEEDEADMTEKAVVDRSFQKTPIHNNVLDQNMDSGPPTTPLLARRQCLENPFSSKNKPPRSSFPSTIGSSSGLYANQGFTNTPSLFQLPAPKFDKHHLETVREDEMPEFLQGGSPISGGINSLSPNRKRVSPPRSAGISPGLRSSRKLILKSIPSFPSLTPNQWVDRKLCQKAELLE